MAGISAGATLAVVITQRSVQDPSLKERITGTVALSPGLIHPSVQPEKYVNILTHVTKKLQCINL